MQTMAITKKMDESVSRNNLNTNFVPTPVQLGHSSSTTSGPFSWLLTNSFGAIGLACWMLYMLWTFLSVRPFTATDFIIGLVFFIWYGMEY
jgi:hypothetical protein